MRQEQDARADRSVAVAKVARRQAVQRACHGGSRETPV